MNDPTKNRVLELNGEWNLSSLSGRYAAPIRIPGDSHSALLEAGLIDDPYWADNESKLQALNYEDWVLTREFEADDALLAQDCIELCFEGLDTIATVSLNGKPVGTADNMFRLHRFDLKPHLRSGTNQLRIEIASASRIAEERNEALTYPLPATREAGNSSPYRNLVRKVQCHSGWDWGICLMVAGIYERVWIEAYSQGRIDYVHAEQKHAEGKCEVTVVSEITAHRAGEAEVATSFDGERRVERVELRPGPNVHRTTFTVERPRLWWPATHGDQPLYDCVVEAFGRRVERKIGLRTLELLTEDDATGQSFSFRVNGEDLFMKGANWIPVDALPSRHTPEVYENLLQSAVDANMNMIRIWGGGQYEKQVFYELCDRKGLLVWQDFMFACAMYPADPEFLANVDQEVRHQIRRLRHHCSIALWCGNNECLGAFDWFEETKRNRDRYLVDYDRLYEGVIGKAVDELDPARRYWPSSPCAGRDDYAGSWHEDRRGDMHNWDVWHRGKPFEAFFEVAPRFCSEFGFQSFPSLPVIDSFLPPDQRNLTAPIMEHHQRNRNGNSIIIEMFSRYFRMPVGFEDSIYLSQVQQGLAIKIAVEHWRHLRPVCMGTLYWQLNDNWPVSSWASLNYGGSWKYLHYMARRFYAPTIISASTNAEGEVEVWVTNDELRPKTLTARLRRIDFEGRVLAEDEIPVETPANAAIRLRNLPPTAGMTDPEGGFLHLSLVDEAGGSCYENDYFYARYKRCALAESEVALSLSESPGGGYRIELETERPVFFLSLETGPIEGRFSDNCFTLLPGSPRVLEFTPADPAAVSLESLREALRWQHLRSSGSA